MTVSPRDLSGTSFEDATPQDVLTWALGRFGDRIAIASSFGVEDVALIDMAAELQPDVRVFCLDTGRLPQETYDVMDRIRNRYDLRIQVLYPDAPQLEEMVTSLGVNLFYDSVANRMRCCEVRKVGPLRRVLSTLDAWVTGLRRDQNVTRANVPKVAIDDANGGLVKVCPLAGWSQADVWAYVRERRIPYNSLHDQGYPSIGCAPCTRPVKAGEDPRAGRWWWENAETKECGLHLKG